MKQMRLYVTLTALLLSTKLMGVVSSARQQEIGADTRQVALQQATKAQLAKQQTASKSAAAVPSTGSTSSTLKASSGSAGVNAPARARCAADAQCAQFWPKPEDYTRCCENKAQLTFMGRIRKALGI